MYRDSHPTKLRLIETASEMLATMRPDEIQVDQLLQAARVSKGSLYHHFEDFSELLENAMVARFASGVDGDIEVLTTILMNSPDRETLLQSLAAVTEASHSVESRQRRFERARILSKSQGNPRLFAALRQEQQRLTDQLADLIYEGQNRGWFSTQFDARTIAVFVQSYTLGKIVDDVVAEPMEPDSWSRLINQVIRLILT